MNKIVALKDMRTRLPEQGRIRYGVKTGKAMKAIDRWRFTSPDEAAIHQLAERYGGTARPWSDPKASPRDQWEVITEANVIDVFLLPDAFSLSMELWGGKGLLRRCDGETCTAWKATQPCLCAKEGELSCKPYSRVNVMLPDVRLGGAWRLEAHGWNFAHEAPGMINALTSLQDQGLIQVKLRLSHRQQMTPDGLSKFIVPVFETDATPVQIMGGAQRAIEAHPSSQMPRPRAIEAAKDDIWHQPEEDDLADLLEASVVDIRARRAEEEIVEAEVIEEEEDGWDIPPPGVSVMRNPDRSAGGPRWVRKR